MGHYLNIIIAFALILMVSMNAVRTKVRKRFELPGIGSCCLWARLLVSYCLR